MCSETDHDLRRRTVGVYTIICGQLRRLQSRSPTTIAISDPSTVSSPSAACHSSPFKRQSELSPPGWPVGFPFTTPITTLCGSPSHLFLRLSKSASGPKSSKMQSKKAFPAQQPPYQRWEKRSDSQDVEAIMVSTPSPAPQVIGDVPLWDARPSSWRNDCRNTEHWLLWQYVNVTVQFHTS